MRSILYFQCYSYGQSTSVITSKVRRDKPEVVNKIKNKKLRYEDLDDLVIYYKTGSMPVHDDYSY